jgi:hypothetical protein
MNSKPEPLNMDGAILQSFLNRKALLNTQVASSGVNGRFHIDSLILHKLNSRKFTAQDDLY